MATRSERYPNPFRVSARDVIAMTVVTTLLCVAVLWVVAQSQPPHELIEIVVRPGDTLWSLARTYSPSRDPREVVHIIREANGGLEPGALRPGDVVLVPREEVTR